MLNQITKKILAGDGLQKRAKLEWGVLTGFVVLTALIFFFSGSFSQLYAVYSLTEDKKAVEENSQSKEKKAPSFSRKELPALFGERFFYEADLPVSFSKKTPRGEVTVFTTIRPDVQQKMVSLFKRFGPLIGAGVVMDAKTGAVLAMGNYTHGRAGSRLLPDGEDNYCLYGGIPAASLIKIITAAAALEKKGFELSQTLPVPGNYHTLSKSQVGIGKARYRGEPVSLEKAFALSINPFFGKIGIDYLSDLEFDETAKGFLFNRAIDFDLPLYESRIVAPESDFERAELASVYNTRTTISPLHAAMISSLPVNGGKMIRPFVVDKIVSESGRELYRSEIKSLSRPLSPRSVEELGQLMQGTVLSGTARGGFSRVRRLKDAQDWILGGKTGSIDLPGHTGRCDWFSGFGQDGDTRLALSFILIHGPRRTVRSSYLCAETLRCCFIHDPAPDAPSQRPSHRSIRKGAKNTLRPSVKKPVQQTKKRKSKTVSGKALKKVRVEAGG